MVACIANLLSCTPPSGLLDILLCIGTMRMGGRGKHYILIKPGAHQLQADVPLVSYNYFCPRMSARMHVCGSAPKIINN